MKSSLTVVPAPQADAAPLLVRLRALRPSLSPAEDRVAEQVLADPRGTAAMTISELATIATTSETTVLRFSKRLGLPGYPSLRLALAEESARPRALASSQTDISAADSIDDVIHKIALADASAVEETAQQLDRHALEQTRSRARRFSDPGTLPSASRTAVPRARRSSRSSPRRPTARARWQLPIFRCHRWPTPPTSFSQPLPGRLRCAPAPRPVGSRHSLSSTASISLWRNAICEVLAWP